jgi:ketosteroid isomerase-like protein
MKTDMRVALLVVICVFGCVTAKGQTPLQEMVRTEQAFSKMAEEKTIREAFMTFIADDGLLFRPGAVNGKKWLTEHPAPPSDKKPLLAWQPSYAVMSASGDMGFTTGPWEFKGDVNDAKPSGYGHFVTVWKRQADGSWKFVVDLGITHPQSGGPQELWNPPYTKTHPIIFSGPDDSAEESTALLDRDRKFSDASVKQGLVKAYLAFAAPELRLYRANNLPFIGREASLKPLATVTGQFVSKPIGGDVSRFKDLGYTHGTYELSDATKKIVESGSYLRIWKKQNGEWRVVMDVVNKH